MIGQPTISIPRALTFQSTLSPDYLGSKTKGIFLHLKKSEVEIY